MKKKKRSMAVGKSKESRQREEARLSIHGWYPIVRGIGHSEFGEYARWANGQFGFYPANRYARSNAAPCEWKDLSGGLFWMCWYHIQRKTYLRLGAQ